MCMANTAALPTAPAKAPPYPVLWVLTADATEKFAPWGQKLHLNQPQL